MIKLNKVTWYSKLAAVIFFIGVLPLLTFYIGTQYESVKNLSRESVVTSTQAKETPSSIKLPDNFFTDEIKKRDPELNDVGVVGRGDINQDGFEDAIVKAISCGAGCTYNLSMVLNSGNQSVNVKYVDFDGVNGSPSAFKSLISTITIKDGVISITGSGLDCQDGSGRSIYEVCKIENNQWLETKTINYKFDGAKVIRL